VIYMIDFTSTNMRLDLKFPENKLMKCPFCGMGHPMYVNGTVRDYHTDNQVLHPLEGYSFCNCKNVWYGDWKNIDQNKYHYNEKMQSSGITESNAPIRVHETIVNLSSHNKEINTFLDVGCGLHYMDSIIHKELGWDVTGVDMQEDLLPTNRKMIIGNIGDKKTFEGIGKFDVVWASHVIEHLKDPIRFLTDIKDNLEDGGILFIISPDPAYFDLLNPTTYPNFGIHQHYTIWNLYDYAEEVKAAGYIVEKGMHHPNPLTMEWHILAIKPSKRNKQFMEIMDGKTTGMVPLECISPEDVGHRLNNIDKEHLAGAEVVKKLIQEGKKILPIACTYYGKRLDGFKRYLAYRDLGIKEIEVIIETKGGCQDGESWEIYLKS